MDYSIIDRVAEIGRYALDKAYSLFEPKYAFAGMPFNPDLRENRRGESKLAEYVCLYDGKRDHSSDPEKKKKGNKNQIKTTRTAIVEIDNKGRRHIHKKRNGSR
jgi:hypothetical protein